MWKKSFIFLVVCLLAASSLYCYPSWVYGKKETLQKVEIPVETKEEIPTVAMEEEPAPAEEQETPESSLNSDEPLPNETLKEQGEQLKNSLKEEKVSTAVIEQVSEYIENTNLGVDVMTEAYNLEVENHAETERALKKVTNAFRFTVNPYISFDKNFKQLEGYGLNLIVAKKGLGISIGAYKPSFSFENWEDTLLTTGLSFTF